MKRHSLHLDNASYEWSASQDGENAEFILFCTSGEIYVQVQIGSEDREQSKKHLLDNVGSPITESTAERIVSDIIELGYLGSYFESDVGLIFTDDGRLIEN